MHKLIVAVERVDQAKSVKDIVQAQALIEALAVRRPAELRAAWQIAWEGGTRWRTKLDAGRRRLSAAAQEVLATLLKRPARAGATPRSRRYPAIFSSLAAVRPRMSSLSSSVRAVQSMMWSTGWFCQT